MTMPVGGEMTIAGGTETTAETDASAPRHLILIDTSQDKIAALLQ